MSGAYDSKLMNDFADVEDDGSMTMDKMADMFFDNGEQTTQEVTPEPVQETTPAVIEPEQVTQTEDLNELTLEDLEALLGKQETPVETVVVEEEEEQKNDGNLNAALHQARTKASNQKKENELLKQELDLIKQKLDLLNSNTSQPNQTIEQPVQSEDVLADLEDTDVISKADLNRILKKQQEQLLASQQQTTQQQNLVQAQKLEQQFQATHGDDLGVMSYNNIMSLYNMGKVSLSEGQLYDIRNSIGSGKNPAEVFYNSVIQSTPALQKKQLEISIKELIKEKSKTGATQVESPQSIEDDFSNMSHNSKDNLKSHYQSLSDF